ncbi:glycosyltransferase family 2 protein [Bifidobacterium reuteri]|uniref:Glycosyltransferase family 2 protein n=1 Tax=Bifidobacterium reuteri TaxID=983706 RepID=A0A5J5E7W1_9BIFI|nr:glycosyltransferase family 2 protein [Bifidobacterium reuteri]KAA8825489.1 glycosyltransferase family 2 protein [Bifidobacterium reuteri]
MPTFSLVVAAYNRGPYMQQCLDTLVGQTFRDIEIIVVDDASTDNTLDIIQTYAQRDCRIKVIAKKHNGGAHLARIDGCLASTGDYLIFVDGDDELETKTCEILAPYVIAHDVDIVRFGRTVLGEGECNQKNVSALEGMYNRKCSELYGEQILSALYSDQEQRLTYCVIDSVFKGPMIREAFGRMTHGKLGRMEDAYESFVIADHAKSLIAVPECRMLIYHFGRGISGNNVIPLEVFDRDQSNMNVIANSVVEYAENRNAFVRGCSAWFIDDVLRIVANEWEHRLDKSNHAEGLRLIAQVWGKESACMVAITPLLGRANELCLKGQMPLPDDEYYHWSGLFEQYRLHGVMNSKLSERIKELSEYESKLNQITQETNRHILAVQKAEKERIEKNRILKTGSISKKIVDCILPEESRMRRAIRGFLLPFRS